MRFPGPCWALGMGAIFGADMREIAATPDERAVPADVPEGEELLVGHVVEDACYSEGVLRLRFTDKTVLRIYYAAPLRGDRGEGFLGLRGATLRAVDLGADSILLTFDSGATIRVGLADE